LLRHFILSPYQKSAKHKPSKCRSRKTDLTADVIYIGAAGANSAALFFFMNTVFSLYVKDVGLFQEIVYCINLQRLISKI
jgi:hypothetical protein